MSSGFTIVFIDDHPRVLDLPGDLPDMLGGVVGPDSLLGRLGNLLSLSQGRVLNFSIIDFTVLQADA